MSKFSNILKMIKILEGAKEPITRKEIAEVLGVSERMIRKYIEDIEEGGIKVTSIPGRNGGLKIEKEPKTNKLTSKEMIYLKSMLSLNKQEVQEKIKYINKGELNREDNPIIRLLEEQLENILNIEYKLNQLGE